MICFQILTFAVSATARARSASQTLGCDLLSNSYLCSICDSACLGEIRRALVVICFQILTFAVSATAQMCQLSITNRLWFAFKFLPLQYLRQRRLVDFAVASVVICFQILTFAVSATAFFSARSVSTLLWFAFKFLPLQYLRQPRAPGSPSSRSCDLLSNSYLCSICDSNRSANTGYFAVVICFQILTFAVSATASTLPRFCPFRLWFAFKFLPLQYLRQLSLPF